MVKCQLKALNSTIPCTQKKTFSRVVNETKTHIFDVEEPATFLLGFFVALAAERWWGQYTSLPWPDNVAILMNGKGLV